MYKLTEIKKAVVAFVGTSLAYANQLLDIAPPQLKPYITAVVGALTVAGVFLANNEVDTIVADVDEVVTDAGKLRDRYK